MFLRFLFIVIIVPLPLFIIAIYIYFNPQSISTEEFTDTVVLEQGEIQKISFPFKGEVSSLRCRNLTTKFILENNVLQFFVSAAYNQTKQYTCVLNNETILTVNITDDNLDKTIHNLVIPNRYVSLSSKDLNISFEDRDVLNRVYSKSDDNLLASQYVNPYRGVHKYSELGERRVFQNATRSQHNGIDYKFDVGDKLYAIGDGKVVLVRDLLYCGKTVIIDHGLDFYSIYCHMEEFSVSVGEEVSKEQYIGLSGNTGISAIPHLHLALRHGRNYIDAERFIDYMNRVYTRKSILRSLIDQFFF